jgi:5-methyltetrahydropteroyltriglutamate--homocysteine methyltransferase
MKLSTDRILTTHVGSLPRSAAVCELLIAKEKGKPYDPEVFERTMRDEVAAVVKRQVATGIDVVSDGETAKIGYSTYMQERLTGFGGHIDRKPATDLADYPELRKKLAVIMGPQEFNRASCIGPVAVKTLAPLERDIENFRAALGGSGAAEGFLNAASPGVVSAFQINKYYKTHADYIAAIAAAMKPEYDAIVKAGFLLQVDCPDLAMARHTGFQDLSEAEFVARAEENVAALNAALTDIPADRVRIHICWGNYEGPHDHDIDLAKVLPAILKAKAQAIAFEAANPRHDHEWAVWKLAKLPDDKVLIPGVLDTCTNYVEHPELVAQRLGRFADVVGRERVIAGTDCGFGTFAGYGKVDPEVAYKKLAALVDGARIASRRLWGR